MVPGFEDFGEEFLDFPQHPRTRINAPSSFSPSSFGPSSFGPSSFGPSSFGPSVFAPINYDALAAEFDVPVPAHAPVQSYGAMQAQAPVRSYRAM